MLLQGNGLRVGAINRKTKYGTVLTCSLEEGLINFLPERSKTLETSLRMHKIEIM